MTERSETQVIVNPNAIRPEGDHVVTVSAGLSTGLCLSFNGPMSKDIMEVAGGDRGHAWFVDGDTARRLIDAMQTQLGVTT